jgi:enoyl reductase-like protein
MDDHFFNNVFAPFFINVATINVKIMKQVELNPKQKKFYKVLKYVIPIVNRLNEEDNIKISSVLKDNESDTHDNYMFQSDSDVSTDLSDSESESEDEPDEEGDKLVDALTNESMRRYKIIKSKKWVFTEYHNNTDELSVVVSSESESESESDSESESESESESDSKTNNKQIIINTSEVHNTNPSDEHLTTPKDESSDRFNVFRDVYTGDVDDDHSDEYDLYDMYDARHNHTDCWTQSVDVPFSYCA